MTGMPRETPQPRTAFVKSYDTSLTLLLQIPGPGRAIAAALDGTYSHDTPSVWCMSFAATASRSLPWLTVDAGPGTGDRDSDMPSNFGRRCAPPLIRRVGLPSSETRSLPEEPLTLPSPPKRGRGRVGS